MESQVSELQGAFPGSALHSCALLIHMRSAAREEEAQGHLSRASQRPPEPSNARSTPTPDAHAFASYRRPLILVFEPSGPTKNRYSRQHCSKATTRCFAEHRSGKGAGRRGHYPFLATGNPWQGHSARGTHQKNYRGRRRAASHEIWKHNRVSTKQVQRWPPANTGTAGSRRRPGSCHFGFSEARRRVRRLAVSTKDRPGTRPQRIRNRENTFACAKAYVALQVREHFLAQTSQFNAGHSWYRRCNHAKA